MILSTDVIAYARLIAPNYEYRNSAQGGDYDQDGIPEVDCVGFMNVVLGHFDVRVPLVGAQLPYKVRWYYDHWRSTKDRGVPLPGDLVIIGDPRSSVSDVVFRHIGMATDPGHYISAVGIVSGPDVRELPLPTKAWDRVVYVLRTGFEQPEKVIDMANTYTATATVALVNAAQAYATVTFPEGRFTEPPLVVPGLLHPIYGKGFSWQKLVLVAADVTAQGVNVRVGTADGSKVTATVEVPILAIEQTQ